MADEMVTSCGESSVFSHRLRKKDRVKNLQRNDTNSNRETIFRTLCGPVAGQLIAAQHEQMSSSSNFALQCPNTPPTSLTSDDDNDEVFTPIFGNLAQLLPYTPIRHPTSLQLCHPTTPTPEIRRNIRLRKIVTNQTSSVPTIFLTHRRQLHLTIPLISRQWLVDCKIWHWTPIRHAMRGWRGVWCAANHTTKLLKKLLLIISTRQLSQVKQYENAKSK